MIDNVTFLSFFMKIKSYWFSGSKRISSTITLGALKVQAINAVSMLLEFFYMKVN